MSEEVRDYRFARTLFRVEATSYEYLSLWNEWKNIVSWEDDRIGQYYVIGELSGFPISVDIRWSRLNGKLVLFYNQTSVVCDHNMLEHWFEKHCPVPKCNAMNFHHCIAAIKEKNNG